MNRFLSIFKARDKPRNSTVGSSYAFYMGGSSAGKMVTERSAMQMTAVYSCVRILAEAVAGLPLHLYRYTEGGGKEKAIDHPLYLLLHDEPNPEMSSFVFRETLMTHLLLWGNAYAQVIRNGKGEVIALYPLMPNKMSVDRDAQGQLYYTYMEDKDSGKVNEAMGSIRCRNEIGVLAESFAALSTEIDRYTDEILRLGVEKERIRTELALASRIQEDALPNVFPAFPNRREFDLYASMNPAKEIGGDFYDFFMSDDDHLSLVMADVSGKGVPAALFMMSSKILINVHTLQGGAPAEILSRVNRQLCVENHAHMFVTIWLGILEISTGRLITASAGHEYPMINLDGTYKLLKDEHGLAAGVLKKSKYVNTEIQLKKGDSIFVYTEGVAEATDSADQCFGTDRTLDALNAIPAGSSQKEVLFGVRAAVDAFVKDAPQFDDLTMLGLRYFGPEGTGGTETVG